MSIQDIKTRLEDIESSLNMYRSEFITYDRDHVRELKEEHYKLSKQYREKLEAINAQ